MHKTFASALGFVFTTAALTAPALASERQWHATSVYWKTARPGLVAKEAYQQKTGHKIAHSREIWTSSKQTKVMIWDGAATGPGARNVHMVVVKKAKTRAAMVNGTIMTGSLVNKGKAMVRAHLKAQGLAGKIELGDHMTANRVDLLQHPVTRDNGALRYTVTAKDGTQRRFLVPTGTDKLIAGAKDVFTGKVVGDNYAFHAAY